MIEAFDIFYVIENEEEIEKIKELADKYGFSTRLQIENKYIIFAIYSKNDYILYGYSENRYNGTDRFIEHQSQNNPEKYILCYNLIDLEDTIRKHLNISIPFRLNNPKDRLVYESVEDEYSTDVMYRVKDQEELDEVIYFLLDNGFKYIGNRSGFNYYYTKVINAAIYKKNKPSYALHDKMIYDLNGDATDEYYMNHQMLYNNGDCVFASSIEEFKKRINMNLNGINIETMLNVIRNVYETTEVIKFSNFDNIEYVD